MKKLLLIIFAIFITSFSFFQIASAVNVLAKLVLHFRRIQSFFNRPFLLNYSCIESMIIKILLLSPISKRLLLSIENIKGYEASILRLLSFSSPCTVFRAIISLRIFSFNSGFSFSEVFGMLKISLVHIISEVTKFIPSLAYLNSFGPIVFIISVLGFKTSASHVFPNCIESRMRHTMLERSTIFPRKLRKIFSFIPWSWHQTFSIFIPGFMAPSELSSTISHKLNYV